MPYDTLQGLPEAVRQALPKHAQEIYLAAFNNAWDQYRDEDSRRDDDSREEVAHKVAWSAVKQKYEKHGERWQRKP
ncbi:ChaB family protein [Desulfofustis glycolicus]|uniref:Cation transport regulator n=1 Tax=Desulfofustis glycolicus DSM 9705 TaxID=1121409 RepID=A0A1M5TRK5_9BACT|nr:ChaB family protein [Desulfofustis glycolicus]MCB2216544.1 ChaB family protein [Desulfobulbaceae bacterium]SHH53033.1 cation transport regulator [Desulfofustis glycolicus DSM 9705]